MIVPALLTVLAASTTVRALIDDKLVINLLSISEMSCDSKYYADCYGTVRSYNDTTKVLDLSMEQKKDLPEDSMVEVTSFQYQGVSYQPAPYQDKANFRDYLNNDELLMEDLAQQSGLPKDCLAMKGVCDYKDFVINPERFNNNMPKGRFKIKILLTSGKKELLTLAIELDIK